MSSKGCNGKRRHPTWERLSRGGKPLRVYSCPLCQDFHLTSRPSFERRVAS